VICPLLALALLLPTGGLSAVLLFARDRNAAAGRTPIPPAQQPVPSRTAR
jgi:hypothetical protein